MNHKLALSIWVLWLLLPLSFIYQVNLYTDIFISFYIFQLIICLFFWWYATKTLNMYHPIELTYCQNNLNIQAVISIIGFLFLMFINYWIGHVNIIFGLFCPITIYLYSITTYQFIEFYGICKQIN